MTPSAKTRICLVLSIVPVAAICQAQSDIAPNPVTATASMRPGADVVDPAVITPTRFEDWGFLDSQDEAFEDEVSVELALVVPNKEIDVATAGRMIEDLGIMSRIIEKNVLDRYGIRRAGWRDAFVGRDPSPVVTPRALSSSSGGPKPLYLGGYGATFFIQVDFPLLAPPDKKQEQPPQTQEDPVWAQTRQSLREPRSSGRAPREYAGQPYSQGRVDSLRRSLITMMKHAANIRGLEPAEWLTFVVQGTASPSAGPERGATTGTAVPMIGSVRPSGRSVMTLRTTKADVDAFAKGQLSQEQFEQRVQTITY